MSLAGPEKKDYELTAKLEEYMHSKDLYEKEEENVKRERVLGRLYELVQEWVQELSVKKGMSEDLAKDVEAKIFTFGSFRLGVHGRSSDIDTLCVAPMHITREDFFETFYPKLKAQTSVSDIVCVRDAFVPVMKFEIDSVQV